jgi:hypothetical protein
MKHKCSRCKLEKDVRSFSVSNGKVNKRCRECYRDDHRAIYVPKGGQTDDVRNCRECNREYAPKQRTESFFCSRVCKDKNRREKDKAKRLASKTERLCVGCNETIPRSARADKKWCSEECASRVRGHTMNTQRRIRTNEAIQNFKRIDIYERDGWICQLCKKAVNPKLSFPSPACASLDHVIPLSRGGSHQATNVQLAHLRCNTSRGNKVENLSPRPPLILQQKIVFSLSEASKLIGVSKAVLLRGVETGKVPFIQDGKFGSRYLEEKVVAKLILTGVEGSLRWRKEQPKIVANRIRSSNCPNCGKSFIVNQAQKKYCSAVCVREAANSRRRQISTKIKCSICGKAIMNRQLNKRINLCSQECVNTHRRNRNTMTRTKICSVCDKTFNLPKKQGHPPATCSVACAKKWPSIKSKAWYKENKAER